MGGGDGTLRWSGGIKRSDRNYRDNSDYRGNRSYRIIFVNTHCEWVLAMTVCLLAVCFRVAVG